MERLARQRLHGATALLLLIAVTIGTPVLLARVAGWPLPRVMPDWSRVRVAIAQGDIPADTVVKVLAVVVWLIWLQVVWALAWELAVNVPRVGVGRRPRSAPLVAAPVGNGVGRLVALVMSIGITVASVPGPAVALPSPSGARSVAAGESSAPTVMMAPGRPTESVASAPRWKVGRHDSLWRIAEAALGEGDRSTEILELNSGLRSARDVRAGQVLLLPVDAVVPDDRQPVADEGIPVASAEEAGSEATYVEPTQIVIERGDTLWDLSEERLALVDSDVTPGETLDHVNLVIAANADVVEDPDLIYPGEIFAFPSVGTPPEPAVPEVDAEVPAEEDARDLLPPPATRIGEEPPAEREFVVPPPTTVPMRTSPTAVAPVVDEVGESISTAQVGEGPRNGAPWVAGVSGATVLASGVLLMYRRRLALRASRGARAYRGAMPDDPTTLRVITRASDVSLLRWANHEFAELFATMGPGDVVGMPVAVELSEEHGIEILWTEANPTAPRPWEANNDGWSWRLLYDEDLPLPDVEQAAVLPALVTIGTRAGNQLLVNLEAVGCLGVEAGDETADAFARSIIVELAASELLSDSYLLCVGVPLDGAAHFDRIQSCDEPAALERLMSAAEVGDRFLGESGVKSAFESRLGGDADGRDSTIAVVHAADSIGEQFAGVARPGLGACAVIVGAAGEGSPSVSIGDDGSALLQPLGIRFEPSSLPLPTMEAISDLLDEASEPFHESSGASSDRPLDAVAVEAPTEAELMEGLGDDDDWELPEPAVLVRVLGVPEVVGYPQLGRIETSIVTYLACHGGKRTADQIINAVWNGRLVEPKTLWNKISKIRSVLGPELVPPRLPNSPSVVLAGSVVTDLSQLRELYDRARDVSESEALKLLLRGLEQVQGVPFDSSDYDWAHETQDQAIACEVIESAALLCSSIALNLGDVASARTAVTLGLRALPLNEPLYRERMRVGAAAGNPESASGAFAELSRGPSV